jgi:cation diffusion facilitator CzcD-associated flavoprotein CzcO
MGPNHFDVIVVGAGLSGIGAGYRLQTMCPTKTYTILEGREASGGTWDLFRYPGVRSDSDMFTLGYPFRPWRKSKAIAEGGSILQYIRDSAAEYGIDRLIRYRHEVVSAEWDSAAARWTVIARAGEEESPVEFTCSFLYMCSGYYSYEGGYMPEFPGTSRYEGLIIHPQKWPDDLEYEGKRVVIIGSGATAVTLMPAMAEKAAQVTMLQRSPGYIASLPAVDPMAAALDRFVPPAINHRLSRWKSVVLTQAFYQFCRRRPRLAKRMLQAGIANQLPVGYPIDPDFNPAYDPWDQRMCLVPDGDLFKAMSAGKASVATGRISTFTEKGIQLEDGTELEADIVVSATGLQLVSCGGISITVDGFPVAPGETHIYRGCMLSDVPNFAICVGYTNASWTLRADISSRFVCRLIKHMDKAGYVRAVPRYREPDTTTSPLLGLNSGYVQRATAILPKQGARPPWRLRQNYLLDFLESRRADLGESMEWGRAPQLGRGGERPAVAATA